MNTKYSLRSSFTAATISLALATVAYAAPGTEPGYVDMGPFLPASRGQVVEVNLSPALLKFVARIAKTQEPEAADLLGSLKSIRVNVVRLDDHNRGDALEKMEGVRRQIESQGWTKLVSVREKNGGDNVEVHIKQQSEDFIQGLVVTVMDKKGEAVFVNIVGNVSADKLGAIAEKFNIEPLRKLKIQGVKS